MWEARGRVALIEKAWFGGLSNAQGGDAQIADWALNPPDFRGEVKPGYQFQLQQLDQFGRKQPLLAAADQGALGFWDQLGARLGQFSGDAANLQSQFGGLPADLQAQFGQLPGQLLENFGQGSPMMDLYRNAAETIANRGELPSWEKRKYDVETASRFGAMGNPYGNQAIVSQFLNRGEAQERRYDRAEQQAYRAQQGQSTLAQIAQGLGVGLAGARQGLGTGLAQARLGVEQGISGLQTSGLNQLLGVESGKVGNFVAATSPVLGYLSNRYGQATNAQIGQAGIEQQGNIAQDNKSQGLFNTVISSLGSVAGGIAMSDERLKQKLKDTELKTLEGIELKTWEYKTRPGVKFLGVTAQDVEAKDPAHVFTDPLSGLKAVSAKYAPVQLTEEALQWI